MLGYFVGIHHHHLLRNVILVVLASYFRILKFFLENFNPNILRPQFLAFLQSRPFLKRLAIDVIFLQQSGDGSIKIMRFPDEIDNIHLPTGLKAAFQNECSVRPVQLNIEDSEGSFKESEEIVEEVKGIGLDLSVLVVHKDPFGHTHLETFLAVEFKDEEDEDEGAHQTSHVRKEGIYFVEIPAEFVTLG